MPSCRNYHKKIQVMLHNSSGFLKPKIKKQIPQKWDCLNLNLQNEQDYEVDTHCDQSEWYAESCPFFARDPKFTC